MYAMPTRKIVVRRILSVVARQTVLIIIAHFQARAHNLPHCVGREMELGNETRMRQKEIHTQKNTIIKYCWTGVFMCKKGIPQIATSMRFVVVVVALKLTPLHFCCCCNNCDRRPTAFYWFMSREKESQRQRSPVIDWWLALTFGYLKFAIQIWIKTNKRETKESKRAKNKRE